MQKKAVAEQNGLLIKCLVLGDYAQQLYMDVLFERRPRVTIQIWLKLRPALPYPNRSSCLGLSEGLLRAKLSMMVELSNDRSRSF